MLSKFRIGPRLILLIAVQAIVLLAIGATAVIGLNLAASYSDTLNRTVGEGTRLGYVADTVRSELLSTVDGTNNGRLAWSEARERLAFARRQFEEDWSNFSTSLSPDEAEFAEDVLAPSLSDVRQAFIKLREIFDAEDADALKAFADTDVETLVEPFLNALSASASERQMASEETFAEAISRNQTFLYVSLGVIIAGVVLASVLGFLIYRSISTPIGQISRTVREVADGNYDVRAGVVSGDELGELGAALDGLIEDKVTTLVTAEYENEQLNDSVFRLLEGVSRLSERDLTAQVPVSADVTGPVADAINQMAEETGRVLSQVQRIANHVGAACATVNKKAVAVNQSANAQQTEVEKTAAELAAASSRLDEIAAIALECNTMAEATTKSTDTAMETVTGTLGSMNEIREAIQETGKRIKRLGERSQEITGIVDIINTIAERTHMLAVNASMQAAAAGEAGRGFAVVADEVQRLAESSREATGQIASLVKNIQVDTNDTIVTMDRTISQVVEGSHMAESAGQQMSTNRELTGKLVASVAEIAKGSQEQAEIGTQLQSRASDMLNRSRATMQEVTEQTTQTKNLVKYARMLLQTVRVFKLPEREAA